MTGTQTPPVESWDATLRNWIRSPWIRDGALIRVRTEIPELLCRRQDESVAIRSTA